jgi:hypothetical protein
MADLHANPSRDPANDDSLLGMARQILDKFLQQVDDCLPARVVSYDRTTNRATVIPMVKVLTTDNRQIGRAQIASVPVMQFGGNGVALSFDLKAGDLGWIKANDRDISLVVQAYKDSAPNTLRKHSFQDAVFIPDVMHGLTINPEDEHNAVLQTLDGSVRVSIWPDRVKITAGDLHAEIGPANIKLTNGGGGLTVTPTGGSAVGHWSFPDGVSIGGIEFGTHVHHKGGGPNTEGPIAP